MAIAQDPGTIERAPARPERRVAAALQRELVTWIREAATGTDAGTTAAGPHERHLREQALTLAVARVLFVRMLRERDDLDGTTWHDAIAPVVRELVGPATWDEPIAADLDDAHLASLLELLDGPAWAALTPELLGFVFEQIVNSHEMGAYYTPDDATGYLVEQTVVASVLDRVPAFGDRGPAWAAVRDDPRRYVRGPLRHGYDLDLPSPGNRDDPPPSQLALPAEGWRDLVERRARVRDVLQACARGDVASVDDAVRWNLDLGRLLRDHVASSDVERAADALDALCGTRVLDPTCGSGAFLVTALQTLATLIEVALERTAPRTPPADDTAARAAVLAARCVHGVDLMPGAADICRMRLTLAVLQAGGVPEHGAAGAFGRQVVHGDVLAPATASAAAASFHAVVGNPPFVAATPPGVARATPRTHTCGNLAAYVTERALDLLAPGGRLGLVLPVSTIATERFAPLQQLLVERSRQLCLASFDTIPTTLFAGVVQRLVLAIASTAAPDALAPPSGHPHPRLFGTRYRKWVAAERPALFATVAFEPTTLAWPVPGSIPKLGSPTERSIMERLFANEPLGRLLRPDGPPEQRVSYKRRWSYFLLFVDFVPRMYDAAGNRRAPTEFKHLHVDPGVDHRAVLAALNSSLFYLFFSVFADNRNVNRREIEAFPLSDLAPHHERRLAQLGSALMRSMREHSQLRECTYRSIGTITNEYFFQGRSIAIIDEIDAVLAEHHGLTTQELDHVRGFERRYRLR